MRIENGDGGLKQFPPRAFWKVDFRRSRDDVREFGKSRKKKRKKNVEKKNQKQKQKQKPNLT